MKDSNIEGSEDKGQTTIILPPKFERIFKTRVIQSAQYKSTTKEKYEAGAEALIEYFFEHRLPNINASLALKVSPLSRTTLKRGFGKKQPHGMGLLNVRALCCLIAQEDITLDRFWSEFEINEPFAIQKRCNQFDSKVTISQEAELLLQSGSAVQKNRSKTDKSQMWAWDKMCDVSRLGFLDAGVVEKANWSVGREIIKLDDLYVPREIETKIVLDVTGNSESVFIAVVGEAGFGKTSLLWSVYLKLTAMLDGAPFFIKSSMLKSIDFEGFLTDKFVQSKGKIVFLIDTIDLVLHNESDRNEAVLALKTMKRHGASSIITSRTEEYKDLKNIAEELGLRKIALEHYSESEIAQGIKNYVEIYWENESKEKREYLLSESLEIASNNRPLKDLFKVPLTLRMLFSIYAPNHMPQEINIFTLYEEYWRNKVARDVRLWNKLAVPDNSTTVDLSAAASKLALLMLAHGIPELTIKDNKTFIREKAISDDEIAYLLNRGVLKGGMDAGFSFFHQTFFEHAAARGMVALLKHRGITLAQRKLEELFSEKGLGNELFFLPIYERMLLLASTSSFKATAESQLISMIESSNCIQKESGLYAYILFANPSHQVSDAVQKVFKSPIKGEGNYVKRFLAIAPSISVSRVPSLLNELEIIWSRGLWNEQYNVLVTLDYLNRSDETVMMVKDFFLSREVVKTVIEAHKKKGRENHSAIYPAVIRIILSFYKFAAEFTETQIFLLLDSLETIDLLYILEIITGDSDYKLEGLETALVKRIQSKSNVEKEPTLELETYRADKLALYWSKKWKKTFDVNAALNEISETPYVMMRQAQVTALLGELGSLTVVQSDMIYKFYRNLDREECVRWGKWLFMRLIETELGELPSILNRFLSDFNDDLEVLIANKEMKETKFIASYYEAFFKCQKPNRKVFEEIRKELVFDVTLWAKYPRLVDIFLSSFMAGYPVAMDLVDKLITRTERMDNEVVTRFRVNIINRDLRYISLVELTVKHLLLESEPSVLNGFLEQLLNSKSISNKGDVFRAVLKGYSETLYSYILTGIESDRHDRDYFGRLWATCIQHNLLPKPNFKQVNEAFKLKRNGKIKVPVLFRLLPLCAISRVQDIVQVYEKIREGLNFEPFIDIAERSALHFFSGLEFDLEPYQNDIFEFFARGLGNEVDDDKTKHIARIITNQSKINIKTAFNLLNKTLNVVIAKKFKGRKNNEIAHDLKSSCIAFFAAGGHDYNIQILELLKVMDASLARAVISGFGSNARTFNALSSHIEGLLKGVEISAEIKVLLQKCVKEKLMIKSESNWLALMEEF